MLNPFDPEFKSSKGKLFETFYDWILANTLTQNNCGSHDDVHRTHAIILQIAIKSRNSNALLAHPPTEQN